MLQGRLPPSQRSGGGTELISRTLEALTSGVTSGVGALGRAIGLGGGKDGRVGTHPDDVAAAVMGARRIERNSGRGARGDASGEHK